MSNLEDTPNGNILGSTELEKAFALILAPNPTRISSEAMARELEIEGRPRDRWSNWEKGAIIEYFFTLPLPESVGPNAPFDCKRSPKNMTDLTPVWSSVRKIDYAKQCVLKPLDL